MPDYKKLLKILTILLILFFIYSPLLQASEITGTGFGNNLSLAKKNALADLSQQILVQVDSSVTIHKRKTDSSVSSNVVQSLETRSSLPLIGVVFIEQPPENGNFKVYAKFGGQMAQTYKNAMNSTNNLILRHFEESKSGSTKERIKSLETVLTLMDSLAGYKAVGLWLGLDNMPELNFTKESVENELFRLTRKVDTIESAAEIISKKIITSDSLKNKKIFAYPPVPFSSDEITPFSKAFFTRLSGFMPIAGSPDISDAVATGTYSITPDGIDLTYNAIDKSGNILESGFVKILPQAYKNYSPEPTLRDFASLVENGIIVSDRFNIDMTTSKGKKYLLFKEGETVNLFARMNQPGYFYILAHNLKENKYSYLIDFYDSPGNEKFIFNVSPEMVNKWINIGEFEVVPPFGTEKIEIFGSTKYPVDAIPHTQLDKKTGLYKLNESPEEAVIKTRGLIRKNRIEKKAETSEAFITITTSAR
ncbi:MAG: hypothetical protein AB7E04_01740 [Desulfobacteraceae bacterium]|jgi:hypothetical protein